jgi:hypothetical protein
MSPALILLLAGGAAAVAVARRRSPSLAVAPVQSPPSRQVLRPLGTVLRPGGGPVLRPNLARPLVATAGTFAGVPASTLRRVFQL